MANLVPVTFHPLGRSPPFSCHYLCYPPLRSLSPLIIERLVSFANKDDEGAFLPPLLIRIIWAAPRAARSPGGEGQEKERLPFDVNRLSSSLAPSSFNLGCMGTKKGGLNCRFFSRKKTSSSSSRALHFAMVLKVSCGSSGNHFCRKKASAATAGGTPFGPSPKAHSSPRREVESK